MKEAHAKLVEIAGHISSLATQRSMSSDEHYEYSEPMAVGGPTGLYRLRSPFNSTNVQWHLDYFSSPTGNANAIVGNDPNIILPGFASTDTPTTELSPIRGLIVSVTTTNSVPVDSAWYDLTNSNSILYAFLSVTGGNSGYLTFQFRRKR